MKKIFTPEVLSRAQETAEKSNPARNESNDVRKDGQNPEDSLSLSGRPVIEFRTGEEFNRLVIVTIETKEGLTDVLFDKEGELVLPGEQDETVRKLGQFFNKPFDTIIFNNRLCYGRRLKSDDDKRTNRPDWHQEVGELETFFQSITLPPNMSIKINPHTTVRDIPKFIDSHISTLKANNGNSRFLPYLERLNALKEQLAKAGFR